MLYLGSDNLVKLTGLRDALTGNYINDAVVKMSLFEASPLNPNVGKAASEVQNLVPDIPVKSILNFTSGGTYQIQAGDVIEGASSGATATVASIIVTAGTWAGGDAEGTLQLTNQNGTFQNENLNVGTNNNVASITGDSDPGTFTLTYDEETTAAIAGNATTAEIKAALEALSNISPGDITVTGDKFDTDPSGNGLFITWKNTLGNVPLLTMDYSNLTGPTTFTISEITAGHLKGSARDAGGGTVGIPVEGHVLQTDDYVYILGTDHYNGEYEVETVSRDEFTITATYTAEDFTGEEEIFVGIIGGKDISLSYIADTDGDYKAVLPDTLRRVIRGKEHLLLVTVTKDSSTLVIAESIYASFYTGT